jgi:hypothetical protein
MKNRTLTFKADYELIALSEQHLKPLYNWTMDEKQKIYILVKKLKREWNE